MSKIQQIPSGMLSLFGVISTGENPSEFIQNVQPTVDLTDFYLANRIETVQQTQSGESAQDANASVVVPQGQLWRVLTISGLVSDFTVGTAGEFHVGIVTPDGQFSRLGKCTEETGGGFSTGSRYAAWAILNGMILSPGNQIRFNMDAAISGTVTLNVRALVQVLTP